MYLDVQVQVKYSIVSKEFYKRQVKAETDFVLCIFYFRVVNSSKNRRFQGFYTSWYNQEGFHAFIL